MVYNTKKAQGLPLNTIVIALLVVVVLVVIILAFTTNIGGFNTQVQETGAGVCNSGNPAIIAMYGNNADVNSRASCQNNERQVVGVSGNQDGHVCCVLQEDDQGGGNSVPPAPPIAPETSNTPGGTTTN